MLARVYNACQRRINKYLCDIKGFNTDRKIVVIESDDWGSVRMPSERVYNSLMKRGVRVDTCIFDKFDSLESKEDMCLLFDLLYKFKDMNSNPAIITANSLVANPDFEKIRESKFESYFYKDLPSSLKEEGDNCLEAWYEGIKSSVFHPQFHGREHINIKRWLSALKSGLKELLIAFEYGTFCIGDTKKYPLFVAAFDSDNESEYVSHLNILDDGDRLFNNIFGYHAKSFIAPNYIWNQRHESELAKLGISVIQGGLIQLIPQNNNKYRRSYHYTGQNNMLGQTYLVRNCIFEPSANPNKDWVDSCMRQVDDAFKCNHPAIICSHRVNFMGRIDKRNRDQNLRLLEDLLKSIILKWQNIEFMTSDQLGELIVKSKVKFN